MVLPLIKIKNLSKSFSHTNILRDINLDIMPGEILGLIGVSGAGKTTFLNSIIGFYRPETGSVMFLSKDGTTYKSIIDNKHEAKHLYGFASQLPSFYEKLTAKENLEYFGKLYDLKEDLLNDNIRTLLKIMNLENNEHILAKNLSGGMERRLDIACSLVHNPKLLILDEPTADLDPALRKHIIEMIAKINKQGTTILLSSHHLDELESICSRVAIMKDRQIVALGTVDELKNKFSKYEEITITSNPGDYSKLSKSLIKRFKNIIKEYDCKSTELILFCENPKKHLSNIIKAIESSGEKIKDLRFSKPTLNQIFMSLNNEDFLKMKSSKKIDKKTTDNIKSTNLKKKKIVKKKSVKSKK
ncbi:ABC transporter ATP-binding protein [Candidatus Woesearchaeota archaeon]|nr:ABC transporter ATP-binding protein [Candidatus Woesearchaeota archaeon]MCF7901312.1 ABC transporter ATP-binding protein [Candidatus Woesearchaeota archaeon]MCF8013782.1 ABC transporter ATP-binding protein [Candidatus Woesearchaeota archaeon]